VTLRLRPATRVVRRLLRMSRVDATLTVESVDQDGVVRRVAQRVVLLR
jgi:hypothetical protein